MQETSTTTNFNICKKCGGYLIAPDTFTGTPRMCVCNKKCDCEKRCETCGGLK